MSHFIVAIPARYDSQRLPGKVLRRLAGRPMICHVVERALESGAAQVVVATDSVQIADAVGALECQVCMTSKDHQSGTDRLAECARSLDWANDQIVVNLQGDEPLLPGAWLKQVAEDLAESQAAIATLCHRIEARQEVFDPNVVKLVLADNGQALYFSRAPIPWDRQGFAPANVPLNAQGRWFRHVGVYAYRARFLREFVHMEVAPLERLEQLEQLRALAHGFAIQVREIHESVPPGVDTQEDLQRVENMIRQSGVK